MPVPVPVLAPVVPVLVVDVPRVLLLLFVLMGTPLSVLVVGAGPLSSSSPLLLPQATAMATAMPTHITVRG